MKDYHTLEMCEFTPYVNLLFLLYFEIFTNGLVSTLQSACSTIGNSDNDDYCSSCNHRRCSECETKGAKSFVY